jgi:hypothetical protein
MLHRKLVQGKLIVMKREEQMEKDQEQARWMKSEFQPKLNSRHEFRVLKSVFCIPTTFG